MRRGLVVVVVLVVCAASTCAPGEAPPDIEALRDPVMCSSCHVDHYREWSGSMHAYASKDPVFLAMNARGQRETNGALGDFCVRCHAPMAVALGETTDGLNLPELPSELQGITCVFCHSVAAVAGEHNNPLVLLEDGTMRGGIEDPIEGAPHRTAYSPLHDRNRLESSSLCGACHDIVVPNGFHLERTFAEWKDSLFSKEDGGLSCSACHMPGRDEPVVRTPGAPVRRRHGHAFPGVDVALSDFPEREAQREEVRRALDFSLAAKLCVEDTGGGLTEVTVDLENLAAGHSFPSGATQDRRVWVEVRAFVGDDEVYASGVVADDEPLDLEDPDLWFLGQRMRDESGALTHDFWEAHSLEGELLPAPTTRFPFEPGYIETHVVKSYVLGGLPPDRVTMRVRMRPMGLDVLDDLVASGDLDPEVREEMPTYDLRGTTLEWSSDLGDRCVPAGR